jgi:abequosyltransferase
MNMRLTICIPTYNFGPFIAETLHSILSQIQPGVEVLVLDSASTDDTERIVSELQMDHPDLRYHRDERRGGIDKDMAKVVELAKSSYCWLFSADDLMTSGAITRAMAELDDITDVFVCTHSNETFYMKPLALRHPVFSLSEDAIFDLSDAKQQQRYFELAATTEAFFSFISGIIVKRSTWTRVPLSDQFVGSCWAHVARLFELTRTGLRMKYLHAALVRRRGDNDSFASHGVVRRFGLAMNGYRSIADHFWGPASLQAFHVRRVLRNEFPLRALLYAKALCINNPQKESKTDLDQMINHVYADTSIKSMLIRFIYRWFPASIYFPLRKLYKSLR